MARSASNNKKAQTQTQTADTSADANQQANDQVNADNYTPDSYRDSRDDPSSADYDPDWSNKQSSDGGGEYGDGNGSATQDRMNQDPVDNWTAPERSPDFSNAPRQPNSYVPPAHDPGTRLYNERHTHEMRDKKGNKTGTYRHTVQRWHPTLFG